MANEEICTIYWQNTKYREVINEISRKRKCEYQIEYVVLSYVYIFTQLKSQEQTNFI